MKIEKNKIVFGSVLALVLIFIIAYSAMVFGDGSEEPATLEQTLLPELDEEEQQEFKSRLDAVNALKEIRETNAPSIYNDKFLDSLGYFDPDLSEKQKLKILDSIYDSDETYSYAYINSGDEVEEISEEEFPADNSIITEDIKEVQKTAKELALEHQLFYSINHINGSSKITSSKGIETAIAVEVDGEQVVKSGHRLRLRLTEDAVINNKFFPRSTLVFGFVSFQTNRVLIAIENINHQPVELKAYDFQDGSEGIYVENNLREDVRREVVDNIIQDIDIPGVPQMGGVKKVFQRNNRNIKITITNNYKLILKSE